MIAKKLGVPMLLWGPRDEAPLADGTRLRDTLCGLFASSKVLHKLGVPFTYIENCRMDDPPLRAGRRHLPARGQRRRRLAQGHPHRPDRPAHRLLLDDHRQRERAAAAVQRRGAAVRHGGVHPRPARTARGAAGQRYERGGAAACAPRAIVEDLDDDAFVNVLAVRDQMLALAEDHGLEGIAFQTFMSVIDAMGAYCIFAESAGRRDATPSRWRATSTARSAACCCAAPTSTATRSTWPSSPSATPTDDNARAALARRRAALHAAPRRAGARSAITGSCPARSPA